MIRKIVSIDKEKCNGCGICVTACHEGALKIIDGKAVLLSDIYCDGLGDCLPGCPQDAIEIIERDAEEYSEEAVQENILKRKQHSNLMGCPSSNAVIFDKKPADTEKQENNEAVNGVSELKQWPCQIKLVQPKAPFFNDSDLLIAADCTAYAYGNIHKLMKGRVTLIGCPKLDSVDYSEKLGAILEVNNIKSIKVIRMEVPCCGGIVQAVKNAMLNSGKIIPWDIVTISTDGRIL